MYMDLGARLSEPLAGPLLYERAMVFQYKQRASWRGRKHLCSKRQQYNDDVLDLQFALQFRKKPIENLLDTQDAIDWSRRDNSP